MKRPRRPGRTSGAPRPPAARREQPSAVKLIGAVALIVALDILLFFAVGYAVGKAIF